MIRSPFAFQVCCCKKSALHENNRSSICEMISHFSHQMELKAGAPTLCCPDCNCSYAHHAASSVGRPSASHPADAASKYGVNYFSAGQQGGCSSRVAYQSRMKVKRPGTVTEEEAEGISEDRGHAQSEETEAKEVKTSSVSDKSR